VLLLCTGSHARQQNRRGLASLSEKDVEALADQWRDDEDRAQDEEDERAMKLKKAPTPQEELAAQLGSGQFQMPANIAGLQMPAGAASSGGDGKGKTLGYVFVTLLFDGCCPSDRKAITALARRWSSLLAATGMDAPYQVWKDDQVMFQTQHERHVHEITEFVLSQPETAIVRHDLENKYGPAASAEFRERHQKELADREAAKAEKQQKVREEAERRKAQEARKRESKKCKKGKKGKRRASEPDKAEL